MGSSMRERVRLELPPYNPTTNIEKFLKFPLRPQRRSITRMSRKSKTRQMLRSRRGMGKSCKANLQRHWKAVLQQLRLILGEPISRNSSNESKKIIRNIIELNKNEMTEETIKESNEDGHIEETVPNSDKDQNPQSVLLKPGERQQKYSMLIEVISIAYRSFFKREQGPAISLIAILIFILQVSVCSSQVTSCTEGCSVCSRVGNCEQCWYGYWGHQCNFSCNSGCDAGGCEKLTGDCFQCKAGRFSGDCQKRCPDHCRALYETEIFCNRTTGECLSGCSDGWSGKTCNCHDSYNCLSGICEDGTCTEGCTDGHWDEHCNEKCNHGCKDGKCVQQDGKCMLSCKDGHWGLRCHEKCSRGCKDGKCHQHNGKCMPGCKDGHWGLQCHEKCSHRCKDKKCNEYDGKCMSGCIDRHWGLRCHEKCSHGCKDGKCNEYDGTCMLGCRNGHWGRRCHGKCQHGCKREKCQQDGGCMYKDTPAKIDKEIDHGIDASSGGTLMISTVLGLLLAVHTCALLFGVSAKNIGCG